MSVWSLLSAAAIFAAGLPAFYFLVTVRSPSRQAVGLIAIFAVSIVTHSLFHVSEAATGESVLSLGLEVVSAAALLGFAIVYWPLRRKKT